MAGLTLAVFSNLVLLKTGRIGPCATKTQLAAMLAMYLFGVCGIASLILWATLRLRKVVANRSN